MGFWVITSIEFSISLQVLAIGARHSHLKLGVSAVNIE